MKANLFLVGVLVMAGFVNAQETHPEAVARKGVVSNPLHQSRSSETVCLNWEALKKTIPGLTKDNVVVVEPDTELLYVTQIVDLDDTAELLFQTDLAPGAKKQFRVMKRSDSQALPTAERKTYGRFVPERSDDFAWENDLIAFRMYGPALWNDAVNSGVDCWLKRVTYPIIDKWYGQMSEKTYHTDWGEGYDPYHVGKSAGCGGLRIVEDGHYLYSNVFDTWKVLANGPIRTVFELTYDTSWKAAGKNMTETKRITIDLGQRLCRFESRFTGPDAAAIKQFAVGVTTHDGKAQSGADLAKGLAWCWETIDELGLGTAVLVVNPDVKQTMIIGSKDKDESHVFLLADNTPSSVITYYTGYGWEKAGAFTTLETWQTYLENFKTCMDNPVTVQFTD
jgi:hypothetical protein